MVDNKSKYDAAGLSDDKEKAGVQLWSLLLLPVGTKLRALVGVTAYMSALHFSV
jgi:hypothetical protein